MILRTIKTTTKHGIIDIKSMSASCFVIGGSKLVVESNPPHFVQTGGLEDSSNCLQTKFIFYARAVYDKHKSAQNET